MLVAGLFLKEFVPDGVRWAHIDIAGPAFNKGEPHGYTPKGGTGAVDPAPSSDRDCADAARRASLKQMTKDVPAITGGRTADKEPRG